MTQSPQQQRILILDFGSQYTQLIARRVRDVGVYSELYDPSMTIDEAKAFSPSGIILSGGPDSTITHDAPIAPEWVFTFGVPVLGICYGMQTMVNQLGGKVESAQHREFGYAQIRARNHSTLLRDIQDHHNAQGHGLLDVWMSHGDRVTTLPEGFVTIASTDNAPISGIANEDKHFYGLQFHPEVTHTRKGHIIIERFVREICHCAADWTASHIVDTLTADVKEKVGKEQVLLGLSGGVDSSVVAALLHRAIGQQLTCVFVDNGLLRQNEGQNVLAMFQANMGVNVIHVDASERFLKALAGETDPEAKRKIIGKVFIEVFEEQSQQLTNIKWLAQGTIYPDVIESAASKTGKAHTIKTHHNVGGLPEHMQLKLLEPLRELFKDEVRKIGVELGLPKSMVYRHPFPGPGLGVRILGEVKQEYADLLRQADKIFLDELRQHDLYDQTSQAFAVFLPVKSVGVMGDGRRYDYVIALRAVETTDFMTAQWARLPYDFLAIVSTRIINEVKGISRVTYDISGNPPATIEWE